MISFMSIVITGNPGVGKHTVAKKIAQRLALPILDINKVAKDFKLFQRDGDTNDVDTEKLKSIFEQEFPRKNIVVGHLAPYVCDKNNVRIIIVLRRDPYELMPVYRERGYSDKKTKENAASEILGVIANDVKSKFHEKAFQINVSKKSIQKVVEEVITVISNHGDHIKKEEEVDWLELVRENDDLKEFFVD